MLSLSLSLYYIPPLSNLHSLSKTYVLLLSYCFTQTLSALLSLFHTHSHMPPLMPNSPNHTHTRIFLPLSLYISFSPSPNFFPFSLSHFSQPSHSQIMEDFLDNLSIKLNETLNEGSKKVRANCSNYL